LEDISTIFLGILDLSVEIKTIPSIPFSIFIISLVDRFFPLVWYSTNPSSSKTTIPIVVPGSIPIIFALIYYPIFKALNVLL